MERRKSRCYCINLRRAANAVTALYDKMLEPAGVTVNQYSLIINLSRIEPSTVSDLAVYVGLERTTLVRTLKPLIERGLIEDIAENGSRNRKLRLTAEGAEVMKTCLPLWDEAQKEIEIRLGKEKTKALYEIAEILGY